MALTVVTKTGSFYLVLGSHDEVKAWWDAQLDLPVGELRTFEQMTTGAIRKKVTIHSHSIEHIREN